MRVFHIIEKNEWAKAKSNGIYRPETLKKDGFVHCSKIDQILMVANSLYKGKKDLLLLRIDSSQVDSKTTIEGSRETRGWGNQFPHIYGPVKLKAVDGVFPFECNSEGLFELPDGVLND